MVLRGMVNTRTYFLHIDPTKRGNDRTCFSCFVKLICYPSLSLHATFVCCIVCDITLDTALQFFKTSTKVTSALLVIPSDLPVGMDAFLDLPEQDCLRKTSASIILGVIFLNRSAYAV